MIQLEKDGQLFHVTIIHFHGKAVVFSNDFFSFNKTKLSFVVSFDANVTLICLF